ncbi:hypothetical protein [Actinomadura violacea]|uniref:Uncharacterized protein n=1 Tax=Actinomadura violacea TaxID=2819934 RepID=A0ABS3RY84_9ACTN|nr:hypothetical protein [Actinomadura violacea]MBO2460989.1 hypothetical protein [Actinomadura violacea]
MDESMNGDYFESQRVKSATALAELRMESARLSRQLSRVRTLATPDTLRALLDVPEVTR